MRSPFRYVLGLILCASSTLALHKSEAGVIDWYTPLVGKPRTDSIAASPVFHRVWRQGEVSQSVVLTATESNVLAGLNPVDGSLAWRHVFEQEDHVIAFRKHEDVVASISGAGGANLRLFDALEGHLLLEHRLHKPEAGRLYDPDTTGIALAFVQDTPSVLVLTGGDTLQSLNVHTGALEWSWSSTDQTSLVAYDKIIPTPSAIYLIGLAKSFAGYTLQVTALSPSTGMVLADMHLAGATLENGVADLLFLQDSKSPDVHPRLVWLEKGSIRSVNLTPALDGKATATKGTVYSAVLDVGLAAHGQFVALLEEGTGRVFRLDSEKGDIRGIWEFAKSSTSKDASASLYAGGVDKDGNPYIARVFWSHLLGQAGFNIFAAHLGEGKGLVRGFAFPFDTDKHGIITHIAVDAANPEPHSVVSRIVVTTSTGAVQLWGQDELVWTREESLASIQVAELVDLPEAKLMATHGHDSEDFVGRLARHAQDAQNLPAYLLHFAKRFASSSSALSPSAAGSNVSDVGRDRWGMRKVIVAATPFGNVFGIDSSTGRVLWTRVLGLGWAAEVGARVFPVKLFVTKTTSDGEGARPEVVLVTQRKAENTLVDTVVFHLDALTGHDVSGTSPGEGVLQGIDVIPGPLVDSYFAPEIKAVVLFDEFLQVHLYPNTGAANEAFAEIAPSVHFAVRAGGPGTRQLVGHGIMENEAVPGSHVGVPLWSLALPPGDRVLSIVKRAREPVASLGKVLGNRTTLYKYLNPHLVAVLTASSKGGSCPIYVVDQVKGSVVYSADVPAAGCDVKAAFAENWLVYHYFDDNWEGVDKTKAYRVVSVELYEGKGVDDKRKSSELSSFALAGVDVFSLEETYLFPGAVTTMTTTSTKFGMTSKDLIVATANGHILSLPRRVLDPRRPKRKPTAEEQEEWLMQYDALLPDDPRRVLSHTYDVAGVRRIVTSPALLESTAIVFAYGLDLFATRVAPSKTFDVLSEGFNKVQLVLTIGGLLAAIAITRPMVRRKRLREHWYQ